jgi:polyisoprenyl-teichoic acid--peptidoglycan teichoic acid transferase
MTFADMMDIQKNYRDCRKNITQYEVKGTGDNIGGIYYLNVPKDEKVKVTNMLKDNLKQS